MKLRNTTEWPDYMLRRMVSWACEQVELPLAKVKQARFGRRSHGAYRGQGGYGYGILVRIGPASEYPVEPHHYPGRTSDAYMSPRMVDQIDGLVAVTAHELTHVREQLAHREIRQQRMYKGLPRAKRAWNSERPTMFEERRVLLLFQANREALLAEWNEAPPAPARKPKATRAERNEKNARTKLAEWERKLKLAKTKVSQYKVKVRRYDRIAANRTTGPDENSQHI